MANHGCGAPAVRLSEDEVRHRWTALNSKQRRAVLSYSDQDLVDGVRESVRRVAKESTALGLFMLCLQKPGALPSDIPDCVAALKQVTDASKILSCFAFGILRTDIHIPAHAKDQFCMMAATFEFVEDERFFDRIKEVLPSFLAHRVKGQGRFPRSRTRWNDLWATRQTTVQAIDVQLCKLIEQSLWDMGSNPVFQVDPEPPLATPTTNSTSKKKTKKAKVKALAARCQEEEHGEKRKGNCQTSIETVSEIASSSVRHPAIEHSIEEHVSDVPIKTSDAAQNLTLEASDAPAAIEVQANVKSQQKALMRQAKLLEEQRSKQYREHAKREQMQARAAEQEAARRRAKEEQLEASRRAQEEVENAEKVNASPTSAPSPPSPSVPSWQETPASHNPAEYTEAKLPQEASKLAEADSLQQSPKLHEEQARCAAEAVLEAQEQLSTLSCGDCGSKQPQGAFDQADGAWYCQACWETLLASQETSTTSSTPPPSPRRGKTCVDKFPSASIGLADLVPVAEKNTFLHFQECEELERKRNAAEIPRTQSCPPQICRHVPEQICRTQSCHH